MLFPPESARLDELDGELFRDKKVRLFVLRLDLLHPVISGNKIFKLHHFLEEAKQSGAKGILTFGGAFSNHLVATAFACLQLGIRCAGIVRGERPKTLSDSLLQCEAASMHLHFMPRDRYKLNNHAGTIPDLGDLYPGYLIVPEGGYHVLGAAGASKIMDLVPSAATHICCAAGTSTTVAGLLMGVQPGQSILAFPVLKGMHDIEERVAFLIGNRNSTQKLQVIDGYHFGGYAKHTPGLLAFMNELYRLYGLSTDFVYTAKLMFGVIASIRQDLFPAGSNIVCLHTGGLQGNRSLRPGALVFN